MGDDRLRREERASGHGGREHEAAHLTQRVRAGTLDPRSFDLARYCLHPATHPALDQPAGREWLLGLAAWGSLVAGLVGAEFVALLLETGAWHGHIEESEHHFRWLAGVVQEIRAGRGDLANVATVKASRSIYRMKASRSAVDSPQRSLSIAAAAALSLVVDGANIEENMDALSREVASIEARSSIPGISTDVLKRRLCPKIAEWALAGTTAPTR